MKAVADYVHSKGLKFGMYSCAGNMTCAGYPGSYEHEFVDAETFASWDVDFLKYDYCYHSPILHGKYLYRRMGLALENCGRDILFSACSWGADETHEWIKETGASMWRSTGDIFDTWYQTHYALWAFLGSPLMIGCDIREMSDETRRILMNDEMIRINQDPLCRQPYKVKNHAWNDKVLIYVKALADGDLAIGMFNLSDEKSRAAMNLDEIGLPFSTGRTLELTEVWTCENLCANNASLVTELEPFASKVYRAKVVKL